MKQVTMQEFAALCRTDPDLHAQTVAIPKTITPEIIFALAARNGYRIVPQRGSLAETAELDPDALDEVVGGVGGAAQQVRWDAVHTWMYYVMGFGEKDGR